jgi:tRNA threonylcarbamoyladenosine biosynthesis protein TsaB
MRVLALDTTTRAGSAALVEDDRVVAEYVGDSMRSHAERLPTDLLNLLERRGLTTSEVDVFAVAAGPGSFTGLRIGLATMQGLAFVTGRKIVPISVLEALAQAAAGERAAGSLIGAWMDAHRREVFSALYRVTEATPFGSDCVSEIDPPAVDDPARTYERWKRQFGSVACLIGDGADPRQPGEGDVQVIVPPPLAGVIGRMALLRANDALDPAAVQPLYIRRPDAVLARENAASGTVGKGSSR